EGGVLPLDPDYVKALSAYLRQQGILLIVDEVQTGNGRTGKLYGYMHYGITPDIISTAKGLGGGLPIGATLLYGDVQNVFTYGDHGSTYGGNPICCAGALSVIERLDDRFLSEVQEKSAFVFESLQGAKGILSVKGLGLMIGIETKAPAKEILLKCMEKGVLCLTAKTKLRLLPPLNITMEQLNEALEVIKTVCAETEEEHA
ncbi:MAG: aminotransferase class III-fold pyridoxal phosphate-dependent enzyme, partial [Clostridia bacterium]|nr:aminotransferase class III-fold pyridoxal phosphate-dependent enzyme [Clostridia bacterium]